MGETGIEPVSGTLSSSFSCFSVFSSMHRTSYNLIPKMQFFRVSLERRYSVLLSRCRVPLLEITRTAFTLVIVLITFQKATSCGVIPGAIIGAGVAIFLLKQLADGTIDLMAPQANAFATFSVIFAEREGGFDSPRTWFLTWYVCRVGYRNGYLIRTWNVS